MEMKGRLLKGVRLQTDYASHECRAAFFEQCKKSGMDVRERPKPWEQEDAATQDLYRLVSPTSEFHFKYRRYHLRKRML